MSKKSEKKNRELEKCTKLKKRIQETSKLNTYSDITGKQALLMIPLTKFFCQASNIRQVLPILDGKSNISLRIIDWFVTNYSKKYNIIYNLSYYRSRRTKGRVSQDCRISELNKINLENEEYNLFNNHFIVYSSYKSQLKAFSKKQFDPFCRRKRICFYYSKKNSIITTVGQLNFFKWSIENYVLDYIRDHLKDIDDDMNTSTKRAYGNKTQKKNMKGKGKNKNQDGNEISNEISNDVSNEISNKINIKQKNLTQRRKRRELSESATKSIIYHRKPVYITFD